jgi:hypothetical protein
MGTLMLAWGVQVALHGLPLALPCAATVVCESLAAEMYLACATGALPGLSR